MNNKHAGVLDPSTPVHRVGGGHAENLRLSPFDRQEEPPGLSVLLGGTPQEAAAQMRAAFPASRKWRQLASRVGTATVANIQRAGFDLLIDPTARFANHGRLIHPTGESGFNEHNLAALSKEFQDTEGC